MTFIVVDASSPSVLAALPVKTPTPLNWAVVVDIVGTTSEVKVKVSPSGSLKSPAILKVQSVSACTTWLAIVFTITGTLLV